MPYHKEVQAHLGDKAYTAFLTAVSHGNISENEAEAIAIELHPSVGGKFKNKRTSDRRFQWGRIEARELLSNYYEMCVPATEEERKRFVAILRDVDLNSLAEEIEKCL